ncbi:MAG: ABC transporter ATP-binding protein [Acidimicrobiales bacterium]
MNRPPAVAAVGVSVRYGEFDAIADLDVNFERQSVTALVGPNGSGKSTLLRALGRLVRPSLGCVLLDGADIAHLPTREVARRLGVLPQGPTAPGGITVAELVEQGRYPHAGPLRMLRRQDHDAIEKALRVTGMECFVDRAVDSLSGGERQRAWIALTLAQCAPVLLLDEPTTFLDVRFQLEVMELIRSLNEGTGLTVVMAIHDLHHAARYADRIIALSRGGLVADGRPSEVLTTELLEGVFGVKANIVVDPASGLPVAIPYGVATAESAGGAEG